MITEEWEDKNLELTPTGRVKKRKMRRKPTRLQEEYKKRTGRTYQGTILGLRKIIFHQKQTLKKVRERFVTLRRKHKADLNKVKVDCNKKLRRADTRYRALKKLHENYKKRKSNRKLSVVYRNKYKTYEHPTQVKKFEQACLDLKPKRRFNNEMDIFETIMKIMNFLEDYNEKHGTKLTLNHYLVLFNFFLASSVLEGVSSTSVIVPQLTKGAKLKIIKSLEEYNMLLYLGGFKYRINLLGQELIKDIRNFDSYGKSSTFEAIKNMAGYFKEEEDSSSGEY